MRGRLTRKGSIAAVALLGVLATVAGTPQGAHAATPQKLTICTGSGCQEAPLPDGLPDLAQEGRAILRSVCDQFNAAVSNPSPVEIPGVGTVLVCVRVGAAVGGQLGLIDAVEGSQGWILPRVPARRRRPGRTLQTAPG